MKKLFKNFTICIIAVIALLFSSCNKEKDKEETASVKNINMMELPVYYNGIPANCIMKDFQQPATKNADMDEVSLVMEEAIYIFDERNAFYAYCDEFQTLEMYEFVQKMDSIYAKAVELGLTESEDEVETIPDEMMNYLELLRVSLPEPTKGLVGKIYTGQNCTGSYNQHIPIFWPSFGNYNNNARSIYVGGILLHCQWYCTKKWFGGSKMFTVVYFLNNYYNTLAPKYDQKLCSVIGY